MTRLAYDDGRDNDVTIDDLFYRAPIGTPFGNSPFGLVLTALTLMTFSSLLTPSSR